MTPLATALTNLSVGRARSAGRLTVFPLISSYEKEPAYLLLDEAFAGGQVTITETSAAGSVPELRFENRAEKPVLVVDGEALVGAKQNRIANITILVPARSGITIPVSCVERGRWSYQRPNFKSVDHVLYSQSRARKAQDVSASLRSTGVPRTDQAAIWSSISEKATRMAARSNSEAMDAMFERSHRDLQDMEVQLAPEPGESGAVFAIDGRIVGLELFDASRTWHRFARKVFRSYGLDALDNAVKAVGSSVEVGEWLQELATARLVEFPSIGLGQDVRLEGGQFSGGALTIGQAVVHCAAFDSAACQ